MSLERKQLERIDRLNHSQKVFEEGRFSSIGVPGLPELLALAWVDTRTLCHNLGQSWVCSRCGSSLTAPFLPVSRQAATSTATVSMGFTTIVKHCYYINTRERVDRESSKYCWNKQHKCCFSVIPIPPLVL